MQLLQVNAVPLHVKHGEAHWIQVLSDGFKNKFSGQVVTQVPNDGTKYIELHEEQLLTDPEQVLQLVLHYWQTPLITVLLVGHVLTHWLLNKTFD